MSIQFQRCLTRFLNYVGTYEIWKNSKVMPVTWHENPQVNYKTAYGKRFYNTAPAVISRFFANHKLMRPYTYQIEPHLNQVPWLTTPWRTCYYKLGLSVALIHCKGIPENAHLEQIPNECAGVNMIRFAEKMDIKAICYQNPKIHIIKVTFYFWDLELSERALIERFETGFRDYYSLTRPFIKRSPTTPPYAVQNLAFANSPYDVRSVFLFL